MAWTTDTELVERIRISEIVSRLALEPELRDFYVEGSSDRDILSWYLHNVGRGDIAIYPIDTVEISVDLVESYGLSCDSNRSRVIALSYVFDSELPEWSVVSCIVDLDFDMHFSEGRNNRFLRFTDYNPMKLYLLTSHYFSKLLVVICGISLG